MSWWPGWNRESLELHPCPHEHMAGRLPSASQELPPRDHSCTSLPDHPLQGCEKSPFAGEASSLRRFCYSRQVPRTRPNLALPLDSRCNASTGARPPRQAHPLGPGHPPTLLPQPRPHPPGQALHSPPPRRTDHSPDTASAIQHIL